MTSRPSVPRRSGFTLIELLIVIGIIGILSGVMLGVFGGASDSAKAAKCMNNMRNLAVACHSFASAHSGQYPPAGSYEYFGTETVGELRGWISWVHGRNAYSGKPRTHIASPSWTAYNTYEAGNQSDRDHARFALTNGVLWQYVGRTAETYVCPVHESLCRSMKLIPVWSYAMNSIFGFDETKGTDTIDDYYRYISGITSPWDSNVILGSDRVLLFAEIPIVPAETISSQQHLPLEKIIRKEGVQLDVKDLAHDCTLQYDDCSWSNPESIGFNHRTGKNYFAHVAFADGHVSKMMLPQNASKSDIVSLTMWLCQGDEVSFNGKRYERVSKASHKEKK